MQDFWEDILAVRPAGRFLYILHLIQWRQPKREEVTFEATDLSLVRLIFAKTLYGSKITAKSFIAGC